MCKTSLSTRRCSTRCLSHQKRIKRCQKNNPNSSTQNGNTYQTDVAFLLEDIKNQLDILQRQLKTNEQRLQQLERNLQPNRSSLNSITTNPSPTKKKSSIHLEKTYYQAREDLFNAKYDIALKSFTSIINQPENEYTERSFYWIAEIQYKQKKINEALKRYLQLTKIYPQGSKLCASLFKIGKIYQEKNDVSHQKQTWNKLLQEPKCKDSNEALRARDKL